MRAGERAWLALGAAVLAYEARCPRDELLSVAVDRALQRHPWLVRAAVLVTAAHLLNVIPRRCDPFAAVGLGRPISR
jgi:hypothetical protein